MLVYFEAHPILIDAIFTTLIVGVLIASSCKICNSMDAMRREMGKLIVSRNDLLREGFQTLAGLLSSRPCMYEDAVTAPPVNTQEIEEASDDRDTGC